MNKLLLLLLVPWMLMAQTKINPNQIGPGTLSSNVTFTGIDIFTSSITANGGIQSGANNVFGALNNILYLDGVRYPQTDSGLIVALTAAGTNGTVVIPPNVVVSITTDHTLNTNGQTIECESGGGFQTNSTNNFILQSASDLRITGCSFTYGSSGSCAVTVKNNVSRVSFDYDSFINYPTAGCGSALLIGDLSNSTVAKAITDININNSQFRGNTGNGIGAKDVISRMSIVGNKFVSGATASAVGLINIYDQDNNAPMNGIIIVGNQFVNSTNGSCVTVQLPLGTTSTISGVTVTGNSCFAAANNAGGFSMVGVTGLTQCCNVFNTTYQGTTYAYGPSNSINAFEFADINNAVEVGDNAIIGSQSFTGSFPIYTISVDASLTANGNLFIGNSATAAYTGAGNMEFFIATAGTAGAVMSRNTIIGNEADFTGSTGQIEGVVLSTNNAGATSQYNTVSGNTLIGASVSTDAGIVTQKSSGTMSHQIIGTNNLVNWNNPYMTQVSSGSAGFCAGCVDSPQVPVAFEAIGSLPSVTGTGACATFSTQTGGPWAGSFVCTGSTGASTVVITPGTTTPHGWACTASDLTHTLVGSQSAVNTTTCTMTFSSVTTSDVITFSAIGY